MKSSQLLRTLEAVRFSGQLLQASPGGLQWVFYLSQGQICYATGGGHAVRRWRRNVALYCPQMAAHRMLWYFDLGSLAAESFGMGWEYALLNLWRSKQKITDEQAAKLIHSIAVEILFDIAQTATVTEQIQPESQLPALAAFLGDAEAVSVNISDAIEAAQLRWQSWQTIKLDRHSPHSAPMIRQAEPMKNHLPKLYQNLSSRLNGQHTLYELATQMKRDVVEVGASLLPCVQLGWVELVRVNDFPVPVLRQDVRQEVLKPPSISTLKKAAKIACVDDSALVRNMLQELLSSAGYEFTGISDPLRSIGILIAQKPDLIFLDLVMPNANGYEICQQLRKLSQFRQTPIVILTGNDGYANRLRSNFAGASDFLTKPLDAEAVLNVINKYLKTEFVR
ncbi:MAG: response regulator [Leptolyngbyaceae cyanobacterium SM1_3_5]|nr:response regulator [Leptolyngbyaceae cyanobacterium SM1_3_5]